MAGWHLTGKSHLPITRSTQLPLSLLFLSLSFCYWKHYLPLIQNPSHFLSVTGGLIPLTPAPPLHHNYLLGQQWHPQIQIYWVLFSLLSYQKMYSIQHWKLLITHLSWGVSYQTLLFCFVPFWLFLLTLLCWLLFLYPTLNFWTFQLLFLIILLHFLLPTSSPTPFLSVWVTSSIPMILNS